MHHFRFDMQRNVSHTWSKTFLKCSISITSTKRSLLVQCALEEEFESFLHTDFQSFSNPTSVYCTSMERTL